jgi:hypothetical protein
VDLQEIGRKLEDIRQDLALLGEQGKTKGFINNIENADKLGGVVDDVRDVLMDYQVAFHQIICLSRAYVSCRPRCSRTYTTGVPYS